MTDADIVDTITSTDLSINAEMFFWSHPQIVDGPERWRRALAGKKRDRADMRIIAEAAAVQALMLLVELGQTGDCG